MPELTEQPTPDEAWIATLPLPLQGIATRHGRDITVYLTNMNSSQYAVQLMLRRLRGNMEMERAISVLVNTLNDLSQQYSILKGWSNGYLEEVKQEMDRAVALANVPPAKKSNGGIILPS